MTGIRVYPCGYPVDIQSASTQVLEAATALWGEWPALFSCKPLLLSIEVAEEAAGDSAGEMPVVHSAGGKLQFQSPHGHACFSSDTRAGHLRISADMVSDAERFSYFWLQSLVLTSLDMVYFEPLHAAGIARNGRGILLCGDSGAGKTTLAYACVKDGWSLLSDDGVRLAAMNDGEQMLVGARWTFHLREPVRFLFPELASRPAAPTFNAKRSIIVDACQSGLCVTRTAQPHSTVFLQRRPGPARIAPFPMDEALDYFSQTAQNPDRELSGRRLRAMLSGRCLLLAYDDLREAAAQLEGLM